MSITPISPLWEVAGTGEVTRSEETNFGITVPFSDVFATAVEQVKETDAEKNELIYQLAIGELDNPSDLTIAATEASISVELLVQLRNKALEAYNSLIQMNF